MTKQYNASETKNLNYENFLQLNKVWNEYIKDLIETEYMMVKLARTIVIHCSRC